MKEVYIVRHMPMIGSVGNERLRVFETLEKAKTYVESIPHIVESYPGFWDCYDLGEQYENLTKVGSYIIDWHEVE